jgi:hypothetical protein
VVLLSAGVGLALLVLGGGLIWARTAEPTRATTVANEVGANPVAAPTSAAADPNAPPAALAACARSVQGGDAVVAAADASRDHWGSHVRAQTDYDARLISRQQMLDIFAATKAAAPADLAAFDAARTAYGPVSSGCAGLDASAMTPRWQQVAAQCAQRAAEVTKVVQAGDAVVGDWRAHVQMMQNKPHTDPNVYGTMWRDMVAAAPPNLNGFTTARDALAQQPPCQVAEG